MVLKSRLRHTKSAGVAAVEVWDCHPIDRLMSRTMIRCRVMVIDGKEAGEILVIDNTNLVKISEFSMNNDIFGL